MVAHTTSSEQAFVASVTVLQRYSGGGSFRKSAAPRVPDLTAAQEVFKQIFTRLVDEAPPNEVHARPIVIWFPGLSQGPAAARARLFVGAMRPRRADARSSRLCLPASRRPPRNRQSDAIIMASVNREATASTALRSREPSMQSLNASVAL